MDGNMDRQIDGQIDSKNFLGSKLAVCSRAAHLTSLCPSLLVKQKRQQDGSDPVN